MKLNPSMLKLCYYPTPNKGGVWVPTEVMEDALFEIPGVVEIGSCGAQSCHIIVRFDSIEDMLARREGIEAAIKKVIEDRSLIRKGRTVYRRSHPQDA